MRRRVLAVAGGLVVLGSLSACGASSDVAQPARTVPPGSIPGVTTTLAPTCTPEGDPMTIDAGKPTVEVPEGEPSAELVTNDLTAGDGPVAESGDTVQMQYVGVSYSTGEEFDSSWSRNAEPFEVTLGQGSVIPGWDQGIPGMALGGRRELIIPPDLAYGETGSGEKIGPNETLIFVVDLVQVCKPAGSDASDQGQTGDGTGSTSTSAPSATSSTSAVAPSSSTTEVTESSTTTVAG